MQGMLWRVVIALVCFWLVMLIAPPVLRILGLPLSGDGALVFRYVAAGLAVLYILVGSGPPWPWTRSA